MMQGYRWTRWTLLGLFLAAWITGGILFALPGILILAKSVGAWLRK